ncbi:serine/threonine-protein kinase ATR-like isoform X3 [Diorhabda sublineata]|uniref:serine/threonine-protein kinase ATR-like isoform X3 n=1 Tax=Diorhabda sublineata TaxID=1163346 RepID=UPI0024E18B6D|nr:serine/threonine-protein kinase ATR-like isoform X3 [Diorhabda sublineata]
MSSLEEKIPAFSMWKMFNDTVPVIIKAECWEASIRKLASIIQSKEYSNILFIYNKEYNVTNEQYQEIQEKYKAFTVWLLGQFFYLLGNEKFSKVHDIIVDIQLSILDQLFNTQLDVFKELSKEYKKVLKLLVDYYKTANQKLVLQVFIPGNLEELNQELNLNPVFMEIHSPSKCTLILQKLLKFIEYMLTKNFTSCGFDEYTFSMLDHLLFLLSNSSEELQLEIADVFIELSTKKTDSINHPEIKSKFLLFSSLFEKFVYRTFNSREINRKNTTKCEQCLLKYLSSSEKTRNLFTNIPHITAFLFNITLNSRKGFAPSEELQILAAKYVGNELKDNSIDYRLENLDFSNVAIIFSFYDQIYNDIGAIEGPCDNLKIYSEDISKIWSRIYKIIINELAQKKCGEDCNISRFIHFFKSLSKMLVQINLNLIKSRNHPISFSYFDEIELMVNFIRKYLNHASNCQKSNTTFEDALDFFIAFISVTNSKNIHIIFNIIGFPILKTFVYKSENQFPINVIAEEKTIGDVKMIVRSFYRYLWTQNISRSISLKALNKLFLLISSKLITPKQSSIREMENLYMKICKLEFQSKNLDNMLLIILNELLLNFHEKNDKVLLALRLLSNEDFENQGKANSIQEYLQSHFLGVLLYFDLKMISKNAGKDKFLLSLADLFKFMGSKHIMPLRFKIIAMLQTINYKNFPRLTCTIWDAFIRTCEIESLGPHLAVICVSVLPLIDHCTTEVNDMLNYLIIQNEIHMKNHIPDLFFVSHNKINLEIIMVIRKYLELFEKNNLKEKIQRFLKYIMHESTEVRIQGLKQLKTYLEQDREALDQMILDYNGIDATIVELIDVLTTGCREKDETLKLACGDLFGELGAIEPSHLPRRYTQEDTSFCFYINEDTFIVNSLNELIKAFQAEKNTQSMDRYALAIQETLKGYEISPDPHSNKHYLWVQFPDTQREVMLPLLSSRYMIAQPVLATNLTTPIYGSTSGSTFQAWLYNWTCSLISSLPDGRKTLLKVYLPSMKQDRRILMHFMPHILLHALLEGSDRIAEKCLVEIQTITSSITDNRAILNVRPDINTETPTVTPEKIKQIQCTKVVFLLLDYLDRWVREWQWQKGMEGSTEKHFKIITCFLNKLCKLQLAKCNYQSGEYPRALMYLEDYITDSNGELHNNLSFFAEIYAQLEEPDGVDGVMALQPNEPSLEQRILALEVAGKLADATNCYERMPQPLQLQHIQGLTQCYLGLDNVNTALYFVKGALNSQQEFNNMLLEMQAEPLWRLGQYDELNTLIKDPKLSKNKSWGVQVGKALLHIKNGERNYFKSTIDGLMMQQVFSFGATSLEEGAYKSGYGCVSKLHALNELQQVEKIIFDLLDSPNNREYAENVIKKLSKEWSLRLKVVQESVGIIEPILCLRRVSLNLAKHIAEEKFQTALPYLNSLIGESWLLSAKTARSAGMHQQAYTYSIKAEEYAPSTLFLDKAKLHWLREEHEQALHCLRRGVEVIMPEGSSPDMLTIEQRKLCAEAKLLMATYNEELSNVDIDVNRQIFKESVEIFKEWEKSLVCLAHFLDKLFQSYSSAEQDSRGSDLQLQMINYFGKSLQYGTHYIYQSMPRMLSIWFDYGTRLLEVSQNSVKEERKLILLRMTKLIDCFLERLPSYVFLTAFSQLVSRICHPQKEVYIMLKSIIIKLVQQYPQQSLWMVISVIKSSYSVRSKRCAEILCDPRLKTTSLTRLVRDFTSLAEKLIELCNKEIPADANTASVNSLLRTLPRLLAKDDFSEIMVPTFKLRKLIIPNPDFSNAQHNPFPNAYVYIVGIEDEISVLQSLQKPRKISLKGSDGKRYIFMLKPKDDLRKDFRLMEFNDIVNHLLAREGEARQRRLNIRLYSVAPLNEECGLIEWVHNLVGLRPVLLSLYKQKGYIMKAKELRDACCNIRDSLEKKRDVFLKKLIPRHPPILGEWFRKTFPDAQSWLTARTAYVRTTAVMSMAGYMLGLGDRHGENIQLDSTCGDVVHVDFNCLFNKGEKFDWPERVPFRLTHNMVAAMGPLGVDGIFRKSCACTLRVLRDNSNTLMSIVAPFVYDPLVSWPRHSSLPNIHNSERTNEEAVDHIKNIELRLKGSVKTRNRTVTMPLSVEGQTNYLIKEAVSIDNLCQMYLGWGAYL